MERIILHVDVNSAFLSWSSVKLLKEGSKIDLRNEIAVISGDETKRRGIVVASSVPAKKLGIKTPMNLYKARRIYKDLIVVRPDFKFYKECSNKMINFLQKLFPNIEQFSIDECFIDYTSMKKIYKDEVVFAHKLKNEIYKRFGFTVNIGIGNNKLCAKMASDFEKPNKVHTLYKNEIKDKMWPLPINDLFMAGKSSCEKLKKLGINTIGDLANYDENKIILLMKSQGKMLYEFANGIDESKVENTYNDRKGIGFSTTLEEDIDNKDELFKILNSFSIKISDELKKRKVYAGTIVVTIRYSSFKTYNHQIKLKNNTNTSTEIYEYAKEAFNKLWNKESVRLIGLRVTNFSVNNDVQLSLFDENEKILYKKETEKIISEINNKFGKNVINKGSNL